MSETYQLNKMWLQFLVQVPMRVQMKATPVEQNLTTQTINLMKQRQKL